MLIIILKPQRVLFILNIVMNFRVPYYSSLFDEVPNSVSLFIFVPLILVNSSFTLSETLMDLGEKSAFLYITHKTALCAPSTGGPIFVCAMLSCARSDLPHMFALYNCGTDERTQRHGLHANDTFNQ